MVEEETDGDYQLIEMKALQLSMYIIYGLTKKKSIKFWGTLGDKKAVVLINCGASHNFIYSILVKEGQLTVEKTPPLCGGW